MHSHQIWLAESGLCRRVMTVELDVALAATARARFARDAPAVELLQGDSGMVLHNARFSRRSLPDGVLFYLDAHHFVTGGTRGVKDTPAFEELAAIFARGHPDDVVLIDDARTFRGGRLGQHGHITMPELVDVQRYVCEQPDIEFDVAHDIMRIHRKTTTAEASMLAAGGRWKGRVEVSTARKSRSTGGETQGAGRDSPAGARPGL